MNDSRKNLAAAKNDIESAMKFLDHVSGLEVMDTDGLTSLQRMLTIANTVIDSEIRIIDIQAPRIKANLRLTQGKPAEVEIEEVVTS